MSGIGKWLAVLVLAATALLAPGCVAETEYGKCVGIAQGDRRDPGLIYELSTWNIFVGALGVELILPPIVVLQRETYCPTGRRTQKGPPRTNALGETRLD